MQKSNLRTNTHAPHLHMQNVRLPAAAPGLIPRDVVRHLKRAFITQEGRTEFKTVAALTQRSLARIEQDHPGFVDDVCGDMALLLASANHQKRNADVALKRVRSQEAVGNTCEAASL